MATMELNARKVQLAQSILTTEDMELLNEVAKVCQRFVKGFSITEEEQECNTMKDIIIALEKVTPYLNEVDCEILFPQIAELLMTKYAIRKGDELFRFTDIEFYYYNSCMDDRREDGTTRQVTYPRTTPPGHWFFHSSGMDLTFGSKKEEGYGGGILIRGIRNEVGCEICGSLKCYWALFDENMSAYQEVVSAPHIVPAPSFELCTIVRKSRHNIKDRNNRQWQFVMQTI